MQHRKWSNWAGNQTCLCDVYTPTSRQALVDAVGAAAAGGKIRPAGTGYSWTPLIPNDGSVIQTSGLREPLGIRSEGSGSSERFFIKVESGLKMEELIPLTHGSGYTLKSPTLFPWPSIGGAIGTGSHGVGRKWGCFSDSIETLEIVDASGNLRSIKRGDADFPAAKVSLGTLGVVYSVELEIVPEFPVYVDKRLIPVDRALAEFEDLIRSYEFVEMFWMPGSENFYFYLMDRTTAPTDPWTFGNYLEHKFETLIQRRASNQWVPWLVQHAPSLTPVLTKVAGSTITQVEKEVRDASKAFHFQDAYAKNWDISYSLPSESASEAWGRAVDLVRHYAAVGEYPINFALHGRFVGKGDGFIAPNYERESLYIEAATAFNTPNFQGFFDELETRWVDIEGARPHWGKHFSDYSRLPALYPRMADFLAVREAWDPGRVFLNDWLERDVFALP